MKTVIYLLALITLYHSCYSFDLTAYMSKHQAGTIETFIKNFPYDEYLHQNKITNFKVLQNDAYILNHKYKCNGNVFVYALNSYYLKKCPISNITYKQMVDIGEQYLHYGSSLKFASNKFFNSINYLKAKDKNDFKIIGYTYLSLVSEDIKRDYNENKFDKYNKYNKILVKRLEKNKVYTSFAENKITKLVNNIKKGKFQYVFDRIKILYMYIIINNFCFFAILFGIIIILNKYSLKKLAKNLIISFLVVLIILKINLNNPMNAIGFYKSDLKEKYFYALNIKNQQLANIYTIYKEKDIIGHSIWMKSTIIKVAYIANNASSEFNNFKLCHKIFLVTSGTYTTELISGIKKPEGFTAESGKIINAGLMQDREGIAKFKNGDMKFININEYINNKKDLNNLNTSSGFQIYKNLFEETYNTNVSLFQTHLLGYEDKLVIDPNKAKLEERERRILAIASNKDGEKYYILIDIPNHWNLALISQQIFLMIKNKGFVLDGLINLDTGSYNLLYIYTKKGSKLNSIKGNVTIKNCSNLLVFYI